MSIIDDILRISSSQSIPTFEFELVLKRATSAIWALNLAGNRPGRALANSDPRRLIDLPLDCPTPAVLGGKLGPKRPKCDRLS